MIRPTLSILLAVTTLTSCDKLAKAGAAGGAGSRGSIADQVQITSEAKPEIVAAFEAISAATREHNRVLLQNIEGDGPVNELAFSAGLLLLDRSAREHSGLAKQIIDSIATTDAYEKSLFVPFDTIRRQMHGMDSWTSDQAVQRRGYIQIIDAQISTYDQAVAYLERGEEPLLRQNFQKHRVPAEVVDEFLRLRELWDKEVMACNKEMFQEERAALQSYRDAMTTANPVAANEHLSQGQQHEQKAKQAEDRMVAELKKRLGSAGLP